MQKSGYKLKPSGTTFAEADQSYEDQHRFTSTVIPPIDLIKECGEKSTLSSYTAAEILLKLPADFQPKPDVIPR